MYSYSLQLHVFSQLQIYILYLTFSPGIKYTLKSKSKLLYTLILIKMKIKWILIFLILRK